MDWNIAADLMANSLVLKRAHRHLAEYMCGLRRYQKTLWHVLELGC